MKKTKLKIKKLSKKQIIIISSILLIVILIIVLLSSREPYVGKIKDGKAVLADAIYGHEYEFKEIKAPVSYKLADKSKAYKVEADRGSDIVIVYFENDRIIVPNTGV